MKVELVCKNVFINKDKETLIKEFTKKWAEIINCQEKNKHFITKQ